LKVSNLKFLFTPNLGSGTFPSWGLGKRQKKMDLTTENTESTEKNKVKFYYGYFYRYLSKNRISLGNSD